MAGRALLSAPRMRPSCRPLAHRRWWMGGWAWRLRVRPHSLSGRRCLPQQVTDPPSSRSLPPYAPLTAATTAATTVAVAGEVPDTAAVTAAAVPGEDTEAAVPVEDTEAQAAAEEEVRAWEGSAEEDPAAAEMLEAAQAAEEVDALTRSLHEMAIVCDVTQTPIKQLWTVTAR
jgi:hypothetical protein